MCSRRDGTMKTRNKYRFNARERNRLYWLEYWNTYAWVFRYANEQERDTDTIRFWRNAHRIAKGYAEFMVSALKRRCR